jgi:RNase P/RNase MRP subunit POP5
MEALMGSVRKYFGEFGASKIEPRMLRFDPHKAEVIIACHKDREKELQAAVALITDIANLPVAALTLQISGTIRSLSTRQ